MLHHDITPAMPINWIDDIEPREDDPEWEDRYDERLQWRGSNTGIWHAEDNRWDLSQRSRLVSWSGDESQSHGGTRGSPIRKRLLTKNMTVLLPAMEGRSVGTGMEVKKSVWKPAMLDIAFAGDPINCPPDVCKDLQQVFEFRRHQGGYVAGRYKYVMDVRPSH